MQNDPDEWRAYREHPESFRFPHGESLAEQQRRVLAAVRDAARTGRVTLLVTHGGCIRLLGTFLDGRGIASFHDRKSAERRGARRSTSPSWRPASIASSNQARA